MCGIFRFHQIFSEGRLILSRTVLAELGLALPMCDFQFKTHNGIEHVADFCIRPIGLPRRSGNRLVFCGQSIHELHQLALVCDPAERSRGMNRAVVPSGNIAIRSIPAR